jgi:hypothetical protein
MRALSGMVGACAAGLVALGVAAALQAANLSIGKGAGRPDQPAWAEVGWPFGVDPWGAGNAFTCSATECGANVGLCVRAKIGFCDCSRGVNDDEELERVSDIALVADRYEASRPGRPIAVASMGGRSRPYVIAAPGSASGDALTIAFHDRCDLVFATAVIGDGRATELEPKILQFLNSQTVWRWLEKTLGL